MKLGFQSIQRHLCQRGSPEQSLPDCGCEMNQRFAVRMSIVKCYCFVSPADLTYECKKLILRVAMSSELHVLARRLDRISEQRRFSRDFTLNSLQYALGEVIACFPVYRSYTRMRQTEVCQEDRRHILRAISEAKRRNPATSPSIFDFILSLLPAGLAQRSRRRAAAVRYRCRGIPQPQRAANV